MQPTVPIRIPSQLALSGAERLVTAPERARAARTLLENARLHGIDPSLMWGVVAGGHGARFVRQAVLAVPTTGRTVMLFLSAPRNEARFGSRAQQALELSSSIRGACDGLPGASPTPVAIAQALIEPEQAWADHACRDAGMTWVGALSFLRMDWSHGGVPHTEEAWPGGITVEPIRQPLNAEGDGAALRAALDGTYESTLDCPELCGMRDTRDVIASHMGAGRYEPNRWWLLRRDGAPEGCCLMNLDTTGASLELVYLGLSPRVRGLGLGRRLLRHALARASCAGVREVTCAVDTRNAPALKIYHAMGFRATSSRVGFVRVLGVSSVVEHKPIAPAGGATLGTDGGQENVVHAKRL